MPEPESQINPYGEAQFRIIENLLREGEYVSPEALSRCVRLNPGQPLPPLIAERICEQLEGKVKVPRGRRWGGDRDLVRNAIAITKYDQYFAWLRRRKKSVGPATSCPRSSS